ncbi:shikimate kinase [Corallococcus sp. ZKHCc1 1396]|uniref:Shikimate kinase n=1 Tax=Corallococcus soli TaxID=2710757 RepID=A0ABR9PYJ3_9BACT|nr:MULTISPECIES: shikimate kinase [Corallococcus]MBE4753001.1 shikimate kinase [Corallococcus soli]MCY1037140.1 shikimate kinase [Corallococcus sp. BB11-1]
MSEPSAEARRLLVAQVVASVDPRLQPVLQQALASPGPCPRPEEAQTVVLAGHRAAGKTRLLPLVSRLLGRTGLDLDAELERRHGRPLRTWVAESPTTFRAAERETLGLLPGGGVVAVGGGFLSHHPDALREHFTLVVPVSFDTYRERLTADTTRPRLRADVSLEEELHSMFHEREALHARVPTIALADFLRGCLAQEST